MAGALLPAAFRSCFCTLPTILSEDDEDGSVWKADWNRFFGEGLGVEDDPED